VNGPAGFIRSKASMRVFPCLKGVRRSEVRPGTEGSGGVAPSTWFVLYSPRNETDFASNEGPSDVMRVKDRKHRMAGD